MNSPSKTGCSYAHSVQGAPVEHWQTLRDHALAVANLAQERGAKFGAGDIALVAGLLHDVGKYAEMFQRKLAGESLRVDHSTAGARIAAQKYPQLGRLIAYTIAGHHAGLANGTGNGVPTPLEMRLDATKYPGVPLCAGWERDLALPEGLACAPPLPHPDKAIADGRRGHCMSLMTRMIFSALVDADRLDTEAFYAKAERKAEVARGGWQSLARLKEQLDGHMGQIAAKAGQSAETKVKEW